MAPSKDISFSSYFSWYQICLPLKKKKGCWFPWWPRVWPQMLILVLRMNFVGNAWTVFTRRIQEMCLIFQTVGCCSTSIVLRSCVPGGRPDVCTMMAVDTHREVGTGSSNLDPCSAVRMYTQARATTCPACSTRVRLHLLLPLRASLFLRTLHHLTSLHHFIFSHLFFSPPL